MTSRRAFLLGAATALAAPAIVPASSLVDEVSWGEMLNANGLKIEWLTPETEAMWLPDIQRAFLLYGQIQHVDWWEERA